ncbi:DUF5361 domain-containing protein [Nocardia sp. NPDC020380]|uniref:DUF5361 domain-containing protein n=1 Tax=Nocardia sp. NPDC020380 TaxID=3364309 RepID=UPI00378B9EF6
MLGWRDLRAIIKFLPADSALVRTANPDTHRWQLDQFLLADMADHLRWLVWAKTEDARQGRNRPAPIPRPGFESGRERFGSAMGVEELNDILGWTE